MKLISVYHRHVQNLGCGSDRHLESRYVSYWNQTLLNEYNIWGVDKTDPCGPEIDHPTWSRSYTVVVPLYDMSCALIFLTGPYGIDFMADIDISPSTMCPIFGVWIGPTLGSRNGPSAIGRSYLVVVPSYDMSFALIILTGLYWWDSMTDIDINPSSMGPIFGVWIGPTLGVPKWNIHHWAAAIFSSAVVWYVMCVDFLNGILWVRFHGRMWY